VPISLHHATQGGVINEAVIALRLVRSGCRACRSDPPWNGTPSIKLANWQTGARAGGQSESVMSNYLGEEIRKCRRKAEDCARQAALQTDPKLKQDFLNLEETWLFLARGYEYHERQLDLPDRAKRIDAKSAADPLNA
jgi:hypothetical protein